jgi:hypothetical protein
MSLRRTRQVLLRDVLPVACLFTLLSQARIIWFTLLMHSQPSYSDVYSNVRRNTNVSLLDMELQLLLQHSTARHHLTQQRPYWTQLRVMSVRPSVHHTRVPSSPEDVMPCPFIDRCQTFGLTCCLHRQGIKYDAQVNEGRDYMIYIYIYLFI